MLCCQQISQKTKTNNVSVYEYCDFPTLSVALSPKSISSFWRRSSFFWFCFFISLNSCALQLFAKINQTEKNIQFVGEYLQLQVNTHLVPSYLGLAQN